ncbi:MAG: hypothetical protein ACRD3W_14645, partial [Terriglobales bacterium]
PNRWFVLFCAAFIAVFGALQWVTHTRLIDNAKVVGEDVFTWIWLDRNVCSTAQLTEGKVLKMNANDAVVEVSGQQTVSPFDTTKKVTMKPATSPCKATLSFYRSGKFWKLGKVELQ